MVQGILLALTAAVVYGFLGVSLEVVGKRGYPIWVFNLYKKLTGFLLGLAVTLLMHLPLYLPNLLWLGLVGALSFPLTAAAYLTASRERDIAANWTILNLSVVLPIVASVWWFDDRFTWPKAIGVIFTHPAHNRATLAEFPAGPTVATHAVLELGARTALITRNGFGNVREIATDNTSQMYNSRPRECICASYSAYMC